MNVDETLRILSALQSGGATHFKSQDFEVTLLPSLAKAKPIESPVSPADFQPKSGGAEPPIQPVVENVEATQKLKDLIGTLSLSPEALVDQIFPAGAGG